MCMYVFIDLQKHIGMITFQARLGAHLYVANGIRWRWNTVDLMCGLLVEELGASALVAIEDRIVRAAKHRNQFSLYNHTDYIIFTYRSIKSVSCPLGWCRSRCMLSSVDNSSGFHGPLRCSASHLASMHMKL